MRIHLLAGALLLCAGPLFAAAPGARGAEETPQGHQVTAASSRAARAYADGLAAYHLGRLEESVRDFEDAVRRDAACAMAHWGLSRALDKNGKAIDAAAEASRAEELAPG